MPHISTNCPRCHQARRLTSFCFALFALALALSASAPEFGPIQQAALLFCGVLAAMALFRHPLARLARMVSRKERSKDPRS